MTTKHNIAASVRKATADGRAFVFSSRTTDEFDSPESLQAAVKQTAFSGFDCKACGLSMTAISGSKPFCVSCGSGHVEASVKDKKITASVSDDDNLVSIGCKACDHTTLLPTEVSSLITAGTKNRIHCSACGTGMSIVASEETVLDDGGDKAEDLFVDVESKVSTEASTEANKTPVKADILDDTPVFDDDLGDDVFEDQLVSMDDVADTVPMETLEFTPDPVEEVVMDDAATGDQSMMSLEPEEPVMPEFDGDPLADALSLDDTDAALNFVTQASRLVAMKGHYAIATLTAQAAGKNADLLGSKTFHKALAHSVKSSGLRAALKASGFKMIQVPVVTKASVSRQVEALKVKAQADTAQYIKDFTSSLALASAGLSRGGFKGVKNPLRASVEATLQQMNVRNPQAVAARIFQESGVEYAKVLVEVGARLQRMSASARKEVAEMLDMTEEVITASVEQETDEPGDDVPVNMESRFQTAALLRPAQKRPPAVAVSASAAQILNGSAPLNFNV